jgi:hypothetical protein
MKRITRLLARLYPSRWRERYGDELNALLEDTKPTGRDAFDVFKGALTMQMTKGKFLKTLLSFAVAGAILAVAISLAWPARYQSQAIIQVTPVADTAKQYMWDATLALTKQALSRDSLTRIIQLRNLYGYERARRPMEQVITLMSRNIDVRPIPSADPQLASFSIQFKYPDRFLAQAVTADLMVRFIDDNVRDNANLEFRSNHKLHSKVRLDLLDTASLPLKPVSPNKPRIGALGLVAGLLAGLTWALIRRLRRGAAA